MVQMSGHPEKNEMGLPDPANNKYVSIKVSK